MRLGVLAASAMFSLAPAAPARQGSTGSAGEQPPGGDSAKPAASSPDEKPAPTTQSGAAPASTEEPRTPKQPSAEDIIREFQRQRPTAVPVLPTGPEDEESVRLEGSDESATGGRPRLPDGYMLFDRLGRISQEGTWWVFVFESDQDTFPEPPMKLLPNQTLERMVRESRGGIDPVVFIVTGEVTDFRGENYLLPRKVLRKRDLGNFKQ